MRKKTGFTIIEVSLVLGITGLAVAAFMATIGGRISAQRYNDATKSYVNFLQTVYSDVINVQNSRSGAIGDESRYCTLSNQDSIAHGHSSSDGYENEYPGRSNCSVYGKLITFGERDQDKIYVYDVIGKAIDLNETLGGASDVAGELAYVHADVLSLKKSGGSCKLDTAGNYTSYTPEWGTRIEAINKNLLKASLLIVRSPKSGAVRSLYMPNTLEIQNAIANNSNVSCGDTNADSSTRLEPLLSSGKFEQKDVDFCLSTNNMMVFQRSDIRLKSDGHNATAVELVEKDLKPDQGGNKC